MQECPLCGWRGDGREGLERCTDSRACLHRRILAAKGRPQTSLCECAQWPCPCVCHHQHGPEIWLAMAGDSASELPE